MQYFGFDRTLGRNNVLGFGDGIVSPELPVDPVEPIATIPQDYILRYDFDGDYLDKSSNTLNGIKSGVANFVAGRKTGTQALYFTNGSVKTPSVLPINSNKLSISFWMKQSNTTSGILMEMDSNYAKNNFNILSKSQEVPARLIVNSFTGDNVGALYQTSSDVLIGDWVHFVITIDRGSSNNDYQRIYVNDIDVTGYTANLNMTDANFANAVLCIGKRNDGNLLFEGNLQDIRIYNRILSEAERTQLFNE